MIASMKRVAIVALLLFIGCASSNSIGSLGEDAALPCEHGPVEVRISLSGFGVGSASETVDDRLTLEVEVANNSREDVVVKAIRAEQRSSETADYRVEGGYRGFNQTIAENEDHVFEIPMSGRVIQRPAAEYQTQRGVEILISVYLASGSTYRCSFEVPRR